MVRLQKHKAQRLRESLKPISGEKIFSIFCAVFSGVFPMVFIASNKCLVSLKSLTCHQIHVTILELWLPWEHVQDGRSFMEEVGLWKDNMRGGESSRREREVCRVWERPE